jgi:hypothetical protein
MPNMNAKALNAFKEGANNAFMDFTEVEIVELDKVADTIMVIFDKAKKRQQESINKGR